MISLPTALQNRQSFCGDMLIFKILWITKHPACWYSNIIIKVTQSHLQFILVVSHDITTTTTTISNITTNKNKYSIYYLLITSSCHKLCTYYLINPLSYTEVGIVIFTSKTQKIFLIHSFTDGHLGCF